MTKSREPATTPISKGGWKYNHDDPQDRADFEGWTRRQLEFFNESYGTSIDFSDHPAMDDDEPRSVAPDAYTRTGVYLGELGGV